LVERHAAAFDEFARVVREIHDVAIRLRDVGDRRADDRPFRRHVLESLRRADESRRVVAREREKADIPSLEDTRQPGVLLLAEVVEIRSARQRFRRDLDAGPDEDDLPTGTRGRELADDRRVETLVDHAEEPETRATKRLLLDRLGEIDESLREVVAIDAARKTVDAGMALLLRPIEARTAREDEVGSLEKGGFEIEELPRRAEESRELVHAVVD